jgi:hypothetical protein
MNWLMTDWSRKSMLLNYIVLTWAASGEIGDAETKAVA